MAGIYIHIPFCRQACHYCDFHFSTNLKLKQQVIDAIIKELNLKKDFFLNHESIRTIYFGGGTPSLLSIDQLKKIIAAVDKNFDLALEEFTLEANPEDLTKNNLNAWRKLGIDRLSIGTQSFDDHVLQWMNRNHTASEAYHGIEEAKNCDFQKISLDFIYNIPIQTMVSFEEDIQKTIDLSVDHISAYGLTIEPKTVFGNRLKKNLMQEMGEELAEKQFFRVVDRLNKKGYEQYEISNFAKKGKSAIHNQNYWNRVPYLGLGPAAHSFYGKNRWFNIASNAAYIKRINEGRPHYEHETLDCQAINNERLMLGLRKIEGFKLNQEFMELLGNSGTSWLKRLDFWKKEGKLLYNGDKVVLTKEGRVIADTIISELMISN